MDPEFLYGPFIPYKLTLLSQLAPASTSIQNKYGWNPIDCSVNIEVRDQMCFRRRGAGHYGFIRGKEGIKDGFHVWRVKWPYSRRFLNSYIGVAVGHVNLALLSRQERAGGNNVCWSWDVTEYDIPNPIYWPEHILMVLDMDKGTLAYASRSHYMGVFFSGLKGKTVYPIAVAEKGQMGVTLTYLGGFPSGPLSLKECSAFAIKKHIRIAHNYQYDKKGEKMTINNFDIPRTLKEYLLPEPSND